MPVLNEAHQITDLLDHLRALQASHVVFVDGGSRDGTLDILAQTLQSHSNWQVRISACGRAQQLQAGVAGIESQWLLFLHADTRLPNEYRSEINNCELSGKKWGRFDVQFKSINRRFDVAMRVVARFINWRSRITSIATGDQAIFVRADLLHDIGGIPNLPIMEDVALSTRLKAVQRCYASRKKVVTSARRWQKNGVVRTVLLMWVMRFAFAVGVPSERLAAWYQNVR